MTGVIVERNEFPRIAAEMEEKAKAAEREAAQHVLDRARSLVPVATGKLRDSGHVDESGEGVSVVFDAENESGEPYGIDVEYGNPDRPAEPFLRPAVEQERAPFEASLEALVR